MAVRILQTQWYGGEDQALSQVDGAAKNMESRNETFKAVYMAEMMKLRLKVNLYEVLQI